MVCSARTCFPNQWLNYKNSIPWHVWSVFPLEISTNKIWYLNLCKVSSGGTLHVITDQTCCPYHSHQRPPMTRYHIFGTHLGCVVTLLGTCDYISKNCWGISTMVEEIGSISCTKPACPNSNTNWNLLLSTEVDWFVVMNDKQQDNKWICLIDLLFVRDLAIFQYFY